MVGTLFRTLGGDLHHLRRNFFPIGITTREDVKALLDLDQVESWADPDRLSWLSSALKAYAVFGNGVDPQKAAWLAARRTRLSITLARQLATETRHDVESDARAPSASGLDYKSAHAGA